MTAEGLVVVSDARAQGAGALGGGGVDSVDDNDEAEVCGGFESESVA